MGDRLSRGSPEKQGGKVVLTHLKPVFRNRGLIVGRRARAERRPAGWRSPLVPPASPFVSANEPVAQERWERAGRERTAFCSPYSALATALTVCSACSWNLLTGLWVSWEEQLSVFDSSWLSIALWQKGLQKVLIFLLLNSKQMAWPCAISRSFLKTCSFQAGESDDSRPPGGGCSR